MACKQSSTRLIFNQIPKSLSDSYQCSVNKNVSDNGSMQMNDNEKRAIIASQRHHFGAFAAIVCSHEGRNKEGTHIERRSIICLAK